MKRGIREGKDDLIQRAASYLTVGERARVEQFTVNSLGLSEVEPGAELALELSAEVGAVESRPRSQSERGRVGRALPLAARLHRFEPSRGRLLTICHLHPDNKCKEIH